MDSPRLDVAGTSSSPPRAAPGRPAQSRRATYCDIALLHHHPLPTMRPGMVQLGWRLPAALSPSFASTHGPPCGLGW